MDSSPIDSRRLTETARVSISDALLRAQSKLAPQLVDRANRLSVRDALPIIKLLADDEGRAAALHKRQASKHEIHLSRLGEDRHDEVVAAIIARIALLHSGAALIQVGSRNSRQTELNEAAAVLCTASHALGEPGDESPTGTDAAAGLFERQAFSMWARALHLLARPSDVCAVHSLGVERSVWLHPMQRPLELLERTLSRKAFWDPSTIPAAVALMSHFQAIRSELESLLREEGESSPSKGTFSAYHSLVVDHGQWSDYQLFAACRKNVEHCTCCPLTSVSA